MEPIWERSDCAMSLPTVEALLASQAPHLGLRAVAFLGEGWDSWAYTARDPGGRDWVLRFPKREHVARALATEIACLPVLRAHLPLPIPDFDLVGTPAEGYPHPFVGYRMLPGTPAIECPDEALDLRAAGEAIGAFVAALHQAPIEERPVSSHGDPDHEGREREGRGHLRTFAEQLSGGAVRSALRILDGGPSEGSTTVVVHNDLFAEHILVHEGAPSGIIDWGDLSTGDPANDLAGLLYWRGQAMLEAGLQRYGADRGVGPGELERIAAQARWLCVLRAADDLDYGSQANLPEYFEAALRFLDRLE